MKYGVSILASILFVGFFLFAFSIKVKANDYSYNIPEDTMLIYEIKSWDEDVAEDIFVEDDIEEVLGDGAKVGAMQCLAIKKVSEENDGWAIEGYKWTGEREEDFGDYKNVWVDDVKEFEDIDADEVELYEDDDLILYEDPEDWGENLEEMIAFEIISRLNFGCPAPVESYLEDIDWDFDELTTEGTTITIEISKNHPDFKKDVKVKYHWDVEGKYQGEKWVVDNEVEDLIYEIGLKNRTIPGYEMPILLFVIAAFTIGLIYVVKKQIK